MTLQYRAAVLHAAQTPLSVETVTAADLKPTDVLVRLRAAGLCHTDLEVIEGSLRYPMPIVLGHEAAGVVEQVGAAARGVKAGDHVVLSWNPHCGQCFYCDRDTPILCEEVAETDGCHVYYDHLGHQHREGSHYICPDGSVTWFSEPWDTCALNWYVQKRYELGMGALIWQWGWVDAW